MQNLKHRFLKDWMSVVIEFISLKTNIVTNMEIGC